MPIQFQFRRGTAADWTSVNTILAAGEMGLETDTNKFKIGNGTLGWNSLPYASGPAGPTGPAGVGTTGPTGSSGITQIVSSWNSTTFYPKGTVIPYDDNHRFCLNHETYLTRSDAGRKDGIYRHRFVVWDKNWNIIKTSQMFHFMTGEIEFCAGMAKQNNDLLITYGFQDNAAYILKMPIDLLDRFMNI